MNILVVNDDGYNAKGIRYLALALRKYGTVTVVAPDTGRSAASHSIVLGKPLEFSLSERIEDILVYKTSGTPSDCVRLATSILDVSFDLVFSGINDGLNVGTDISYSGTVSAAKEGLIQGLPSVAISTDFGCFGIVEKEIDALLDYIFKNKLFSKKYVLNVNFPTHEFSQSKGYRFSIQGIKNFKSIYKKNEQGLYYEAEAFITYDTDERSDVYLGRIGYTTLTPIEIYQTNMESYKELKEAYENISR